MIKMAAQMYHICLLICVLTSRLSDVSAQFERTIVFYHAATEPGQSIFMLGGISHNQRPGCVDDAKVSECAIPIVHRVVPTDDTSQYAQWSVGDEFLDWYGAEVGQGDYLGDVAGGTPLIYTQHVDEGEVVEEDGYGYTALNRFGRDYWMLDVDMDCSKAENGWFEFKGMTYPLYLWEPDINQYTVAAGVPTLALPYTGINHMARCGKMNVVYHGEDEINVFDIPTDPTTPPPAGCGKRRMFEIPAAAESRLLAPEPQIVNGDPAVVGRWPWQAVLQYSLSIGGCAATLIDSNWALTAGHCVRGTDPAILRVRFGEQNLNVDQNNEQVIPVSDIIRHPRHDNPLPGDVEGDYDIAMLPLSVPVDLSEYVVNSACLPYGYALDDFVGLSTCWATGFGSTLDTGESFRMNEINVPVWSHADCVARYGSNYISERQVCMGTDTLSPCGGDSGGPLVCYDQGQWVLVGLTSWGEDGCQNGPGVYTRVSELLDWIDEIRGSYNK